MIKGNLRLKMWAFATALMITCGSAQDLSSQQLPPEATIQFTMENALTQPAKYTIVVKADGSGHYHSELGPAPLSGKGVAPQPQDRDIHVSQVLREKMFRIARANKLFAIKCEMGRSSSIQGSMTLSYEGPDGKGSCAFGSNDLPQIEGISETMESIASTLEEGARLTVQYQHMRLDLDAELEAFTAQVEEGEAAELENIAPILERIKNDTAVLKRAQAKAKRLLALATVD